MMYRETAATRAETFRRRNVSIGTLRRRLRKELRAMDTKMLLKRITKYTGRTPSEERYGFRNTSGGVYRDSLIDAIVRYEVPAE